MSHANIAATKQPAAIEMMSKSISHNTFSVLTHALLEVETTRHVPSRTFNGATRVMFELAFSIVAHSMLSRIVSWAS